MKNLKHIAAGLLALLAPACAWAADVRNDSITDLVTTEVRQPIVRKSVSGHSPDETEMVRVGKDTVSIILPEKNYGRFDRGLYNYLFITKGKWDFGFNASYGELGTDDLQILSLINNVDFSGHKYSLKPSVSYFFRHNQSIGLRLNYTRGVADLTNFSLDIDEDMSFSLKDVSYYSQMYKVGVFYRNYVGLGKQKRFAVFNEVSLDFGSGQSRFKRYYADELFDTRTTTTSVSLNFSPGVCVFVQDFVAFNVSFGVFGLKLDKSTQETNGTNEGSNFTSGANFHFNIFNINLGLMVVI